MIKEVFGVCLGCLLGIKRLYNRHGQGVAL